MNSRFERPAPDITPEHPVLVLGGGPAGLTAGYLLAKQGKPVVVLEAEEQVGGLAKTVVDPEGYRFDLGGHRFFTKATEAAALGQHIKGLSFFSAAKAAFFGNRGNKIKSLISEFNYPRYGPGQMWDTMTSRIRDLGGEVRTQAPVTAIRMEGERVVEIDAGGVTYAPSHVISSLPLRATVGLTRPPADAPVLEAARGL